MSAHTILLDFSVNPEVITNPVERKTLQQNVESALKDYIKNLKEEKVYELDGGFLAFLTGQRGSFITIRAFKQGLLTINIEYYKSDEEKPMLTFEQVRKLEACLLKTLPCTRSKKLPPLKRGSRVERYFLSSDERIMEYDIDKLVYEANSEYQKIQIFHSPSFGNILVLDDLQNLAESDLIYTETLMQRGKEDYKDKDIVILGGGDGGLLWELLKENPKFVTMIEIDDMVMQACRIHLRSCCGDCLDNYKSKNYEIIVDDCIKILNQYIKEGRTFDYVFADLTDIPLSPTPQGEVWNFIRLILDTSMQVLKPTGKYMTHGNGTSSPAALAMYEEQLKKLKVPVEFSRNNAFVPSFMEDWIFYQVWKKPN